MSGRHRHTLAALIGWVAFGLFGCAAQRSAPSTMGGVVFNGSIQQLAPLHPGDWFVYRTTTGAGGPQQTRSELAATDKADELLLTMFDQMGRPVARVVLRHTDRAVLVVSESDLVGDISATYASPLPLFSVPVYERLTARSKVELLRVSDGHVLDQGEVEMQVANGVDASGDIVSRIDRELKMSGSVVPTTLAMWIRPGVGQVATEALGGERRELVCAQIGGRPLGTCPRE